MNCTVLIEGREAFGANGLTYACGHLTLSAGDWVRVPYGNRERLGLVVACPGTAPATGTQIKSVLERLPLPPLPAWVVATAFDMTVDTRCTLRAALHLWLPPGPWRLWLQPDPPLYALVPERTDQPRSAVQCRLLSALAAGPRAQDSLRAELGPVRPALRALVAAGRVREVAAVPTRVHWQPMALPVLSAAQTAAQDALATHPASYLYGVTGSGKTEIYAHRIAAAWAAGRQAIYLAPEILLAEATYERLQRYLPVESLSLLHSKLTPAAWRREWRRIASGQVGLIIGARSALFTPATNLGLLIVDEEHEWTYKNEQEPRYHVHRVAPAAVRHANAELIFGSATPSVRLWAACARGDLHRVMLRERYMPTPDPIIETIDLADVAFNDHYPLSPRLLQLLQETHRAGRQSVLLLNRRGHGSAVLCLDCRRRLVSPQTQLPFPVFRRGASFELYDAIHDQYAPVPEHCPHCQSVRLHVIGAGTQKLEAVLHRLLPTARLARADSDALTSADDVRVLMNRLAQGEVDILVGTQMVAKGLDLPNVTLAGVILADTGLSVPHFQSGERTLQLLRQLIGRSGRHQAGRVVIQTYRPEAPEIVAATQGTVDAYLDQELQMRTRLGFPPASELVLVRFRGADASAQAKALAAQLHAKGSLTAYALPQLKSAEPVWQVVVRGPGAAASLPAEALEIGYFDPDPLDLQ